MDDKEIEKEIQDKGLNAPRVTLAHIEGCIVAERYGDGMFGMAPITEVDESLSRLTLCVLVLKNGFTVTGESACASPENFDAALGRKIARQKAMDKVWMLEGYLLKDHLDKKQRYTTLGGEEPQMPGRTEEGL